jgi:hypothetical protein
MDGLGHGGTFAVPIAPPARAEANLISFSFSEIAVGGSERKDGSAWPPTYTSKKAFLDLNRGRRVREEETLTAGPNILKK